MWWSLNFIAAALSLLCVSARALRAPRRFHGTQQSPTRRNPLTLSVSASPSVKSEESLVTERLIALRNKYYLEVVVSVAKASLFVGKQLTPALPLFRSIEEVKQKALVLIEAEQKARNLHPGTQVERVLVTFISLLAIFQRAVAKRRKKMLAFFQEIGWNVKKVFKWLVHIIGSSAKPIVSCTAGLFVLFYDDWTPLYFILAALGNAALSKIIKKVVREPRPEGSPKEGYGMPSSHAQTLFYFFACLTAQLLCLQQVPAGSDYFGLTAGSSSSSNVSADTLPSVVLLGSSILEKAFARLETLSVVATTPALLNAVTSAKTYGPETLQRAARVAGQTAASVFSSPHFARIAPALLAFYAISASSWRVVTKLHSTKQTLVGASVGGLMGYLAFARQPQVLEAFYVRVLVPFFGYTANASNKVPVIVPTKLKAYTLVVGFALLYSKEVKQWLKRGRKETIKTPAGIV